MRIAILSDDYLPSSVRVHALMLHDLAVEFTARGHSVVVITPSCDRQDSLLDAFHLDGVEVWRFRSAPTRNVSKFKRAVNETLLSFRAFLALRPQEDSFRFDLCVNYSPTIFFGPLAGLLKKNGAFVYLVLRDFFPQWVVDAGMLSSSSPVVKYFRFFEALNYRTSDVVAVQSNANIASFYKMTPYRHARVEVLYNWANVHRVKVDSSFGRNLIKGLGVEGKVVFFYGGNIGHAQDMSNILRLAKNLQSIEGVHVLLVGAGDECDLVRSQIVEFSLRNVSLVPSVSQSDYVSILDVVHVGLFSLSADHSAHNFPGKLLGYMAAQLPILGSVNSGNDVISLVNDSGAGFVTVNGDDSSFFENAIKMIECKEGRIAMGKAAKKLLAEVFSVRSAADQILASYLNGRP